jgi:hypothetical protein
MYVDAFHEKSKDKIYVVERDLMEIGNIKNIQFNIFAILMIQKESLLQYMEHQFHVLLLIVIKNSEKN